MSKHIDSLVNDIHELFRENHTSDPERVNELGRQIAETVANRLNPPKFQRGLRVSNIGRCARQIWYESRDGAAGEILQPHTKIKFLYGDILEALLLFLAKESGHAVEAEQAEVVVNGVKGHCDAIIDGVVVDVKSASSFSFKKFENGTLAENDSFGYMDQLAGYSTGFGGIDGAFLAIDKTLGHITLLKVPAEELKALDTEGRIEYLKDLLSKDEEPPREHNEVPEGQSGNLKLPTECSYCAHHTHCWRDSNDGAGLRTFLYSSGPVFLTNVVKEPRVPESFPVKKKEAI